LTPNKCPFGSTPGIFALDFVVVFLFKNTEKITSGGLILSFGSTLGIFALDFVVVFLFKNTEKITSGGLILSL
jgi:hypothetical protein